MYALGIDIGGTSLKGAEVDLGTGQIIGSVVSRPTPKPSTPIAIAKTIAEIRGQLNHSGPYGCGLPSVVLKGVAKTAANIDEQWKDYPIERSLSETHGVPVSVLNDADAAGLAEMKYGSGRHLKGATLLLTIGTGIGSALFIDPIWSPIQNSDTLSLRGKRLKTWLLVERDKSKDGLI